MPVILPLQSMTAHLDTGSRCQGRDSAWPAQFHSPPPSAELFHRVHNKAPAVALPESVLVVTVGVIVCRTPVVEGDPPPCRKNLADGRTQIVRQLDALAHIGDHRLALHRHRTGEIAIRRHRTQFNPHLARQIAQSFPIISRQIHRRGVRPLCIEFHSLPSLPLCQAYKVKHIDSLAPIPHSPVGDAIKADFHGRLPSHPQTSLSPTTASKTHSPPPPAETVSPRPETPQNARTAGFPAASPDASGAASRDTRCIPARTAALPDDRKSG